MPEHRATYTPQEDNILLAIVEEAKQEGIPLSTAYIKSAEELQRPVGSVANRHRRLMKKDHYSTSRKKTLSESERLVLKLKSIKREKERSAEKFNMYKEMLDDLKVEHDDLKKKYQLLQNEHQKLVNVVKEALGEDDIQEDQEDQAEQQVHQGNREVAVTSESA